MRFGFGYEDKIYGTFFIAMIFASLLFLALTAAFGSLLRHRLANGGKRSKVRFFDHPKLMKFFYGISLLPFGIFMIFFALDVSGEWAFGTDTNLIMPSYYAGYFLILFLAILGLAIGYSTARAAVNGKSLAARRGAFGLTWFLAAILVYGAIGMIVAQNLGGAGFGSILPLNMGEVYTLIFVSAIFALAFAILEGILHHQANKKGLVRGRYPFFARSLVPIILTIIAGFALLVVGIIMYFAANSSSKQAEGTMGLAMCLLWPGLALTLTAFTCLIPLHVSSRKAPPDPIDKDDDEEEAEANVRDEYGFIVEENQEQEAAPEMAADKGNVASSGIQVESPLAFARSLSKFFRANGLALEEKEAVRLSAFLSYSHLLYIKGLRKEEANEFLEVLSAFFESQFSLFEEKVDLATYFQTCFDLTKEESAKPCFLAQHALGSRSFSEELKPLLPPLNDLSMPYQIPELEQTSALPSNLYHIVFLEDDDTGLEGVSEAFALASVFHLTLPTCEKEGEATPMPLTDYDFLSISTKASDRFYMGEESWKKIDALSGFVSSMKEFTLMNDARNGVERASAFLLSSMFEEEQVFDEIMASCILPHIILHLDDLELIEGEKGLHVQTGIIFGDSPLRKSEAVFQAYQAELLRRKEGQVAALKAETFESAPLAEQHREEAPQEAQEEPVPEEAPIEEETPMEEAVEEPAEPLEEEPSEETPAPEQEETPEEPAPEQEEGGDE